MKNLIGKYNSGLEFYILTDNEIRKWEMQAFNYDEPFFGSKNRTLTDFRCWKRYRLYQCKERS